MKLKVLCPFKDKEKKEKTYKVGEFIYVDDIARINDLVSRKLCIIESVDNDDDDQAPATVKLFEKEFEMKEVKAALKSIGESVANNAKLEAVEKKISELNEEQTSSLRKALVKE